MPRTSSPASSISILDAGMPQRLQDFSVAMSSNAKWSKLFETLRSKVGTGFVAGFVGACGTGKSQMAVSLCKYVIHRQQQPLLIEAGDLCANVKDTFGTEETSKSVFVKFMRPAILAVDEVNGGMSEFDTKLIQRIVSRRYDTNQMDTILISNETAEEFAKIVGDRVMSRINETGGVCDFNWESFR